ncbi:MAG: DCC1-like thiol-disulfide oxidoreductase family protein [Planctomycetota bacterium]|jgi:predicted DCC family thiol-disulfide oxidoreductase YuxK
MSDERFTIYFDGDCPFCVREVSWLLRRGERTGGRLVAVDIAAPEFDPLAHGADREAVADRPHGMAAAATDLRPRLPDLRPAPGPPRRPLRQDVR